MSKRERKDEHVSDPVGEDGNATYINSIAFLNFTQWKKKSGSEGFRTNIKNGLVYLKCVSVSIDCKSYCTNIQNSVKDSLSSFCQCTLIKQNLHLNISEDK